MVFGEIADPRAADADALRGHSKWGVNSRLLTTKPGSGDAEVWPCLRDPLHHHLRGPDEVGRFDDHRVPGPQMRRDRDLARLDEGEIRLIGVAKRGHRDDKEIRRLGLTGGACMTISHL